MPERIENIARMVCWGLAALLALELANAVWRSNPLRNVTIPELPTVAAPPTPKAPEPPKTNAATIAAEPAKTNSVPAPKAAEPLKTNAATIAAEPAKTNSVPAPKAVEPPKTNSASASTHHAPKKDGNLPPAIQARVDRVKESEILGPFQRPLPMALLGIAGENAFLRGPDGQSGMVKEGGTLGEIKLLRIGTNRVLIEQDGEKKELMVFNGFGGQSLLPPETNSVVQEATSNCGPAG